MMRVMSVIGLVLLVVAGFFAFRTSNAAERRADGNEAEAHRYRAMVMRGQLAASLLDELNTLVLVELDEETPEAAAVVSETRRQTADRLYLELESFEPDAALGGTVYASFAVTLERARDLDATNLDFDELYDLTFEALGDPPVAEPEGDGFRDLVDLSISPQFLLNDGLDAHIAVSTVEPSEGAAQYWEWRTEAATDGWQNLGPTADDPLPEWAEVVSDEYADELGSIADGLTSSGLYEHDQWMGELGGATLVQGEPLASPLTIDKLRTASSEQSAAFGSMVESTADRLSLEFRLTATPDRSTATTFRIIAFALFGLAALVLLWILWVAMQSRRQLAHVSMTDPLTGVGNRRHLETTVPTRLGSTKHCHHLIGMIDLDNFKMVNDSWGHAAGDSVLVEVAQNLCLALDYWQQGRNRDSGAIRVGGDEFLVTLHSDEPIAVDEITRIVRSRVEVPLSIDELGEVTIKVSLGFAPCRGAEDFQSSMVAADLAAYEDKARRRDGDVVLSIDEPTPTMRLD